MERAVSGLPASPGEAVGPARVLAPERAVDRKTIPVDRREAELGLARGALDRATVEIEAIAARLTEAGRNAEAEIVATGALIAQDPGLGRAVEQLIAERGVPAAAAILDACDTQADLIAELDDVRLSERADDVRSVGRRAVGILEGRRGGPGPDARNGAGEILVASDLGPAEVAELESGVRGIALGAGGASAHAAIVARSLGIPMVVGAGEQLLGVPAGSPVVVDGTSGTVYLAPDAARVRTAQAELSRAAERRARAIASRELPAVTLDGREVCVLANVSGTAELEVALEAGAEGVGLLRTELAFLTADRWPTEEEHTRALAPVLSLLSGRLATVRVLDFGGDKTPPFLTGVSERGIGLLLGHPEALASQLRAILATSGDAGVRVLIPMVDRVEQLRAVREALADATGSQQGGLSAPPVGAMIETVSGVESSAAIAAEADFLSIGTNDLTHAVLRADRFSPQGAQAHDPRVLRAIATVAEAAAAARVPLEVCGEAASDPISAPLLIGAGVDELSVGAARVGTLREWVRALDFAEMREMAAQAQVRATAGAVVDLVAPVRERLLLRERAEADGEVVER